MKTKNLHYNAITNSHQINDIRDTTKCLKNRTEHINSSWNNEEDGRARCMEGGGSSARVNSISQAKKRESKKRTECAVNIARAILFTSPGSTPVWFSMLFWNIGNIFGLAFKKQCLAFSEVWQTWTTPWAHSLHWTQRGSQEESRDRSKLTTSRSWGNCDSDFLSRKCLFWLFSFCNFFCANYWKLYWCISWKSLWSKLKTDIRGEI